tara:strand:+ start:1239 stop:1988 length:750 start_codon:yes stop_codon:yes gene_type:complete
MSTVSQVKKLKITVTNIKSVLMKRTKRLANLKKINDRDNRNLFSSQKRGAAEKKLESPLKKKGSGISNITKVATGINLGGIFDALKLLGLGIGVNAIIQNFDDLKSSFLKLNKKVKSWFGNNKSEMDKVEKDLDEIDTDKLKKMSDKFSNQSKKLDENFKKVIDPKSKYTMPDPNNPGKMITVTGKEYIQMLGGNNNKNSSSGILGPISSNTNDMINPIKKDTNLSLLNSNGSSGDTVILAKQPIIYEA